MQCLLVARQRDVIKTFVRVNLIQKRVKFKNNRYHLANLTILDSSAVAYNTVFLD